MRESSRALRIAILCLACFCGLSVPVVGADKPAAEPAEKPADAAAKATAPGKPKPEPIPAPADVANPPADAPRTPSGLVYRVLKEGTGTEHPVPSDMVTVHYTGWKQDGSMMDSSVQRGRPLTVQMKKLIPGWVEALQAMVIGEKRLLWMPQDIAFQGNPSAPAGTVMYEVELLGFEPGPETAPKDVAAAPADALKTSTGLATKVLKAGHGERHPKTSSQVTVHYTGWTTDGKMFDSSVARGNPASFSLNQVIAGWTEGLQLMVEGEKRRLWIPENLAYKGRSGKPKGMLVFDVELLAIQN
jgi:peptidylprolyl isomerase